MDYKEYVVRADNYKTEWFNKEGQLHREDGPAREYVNGGKFWIQNSLRHREDGPACEYADGDKRWFIHGKELSEQEFLNMNKKEFSMDEIAKALGVPVGELKIKK